MPQPDERRERGSKAQQSQQTVQVNDLVQPEVSPISGGGASIRPQLQINPNQAQIVKTGGELASVFAGVAGGVQKGITAYDNMERSVENARWNNYETKFIQQQEETNNDPKLMKAWIDANPFDAGRHTKKKYWTLHAQVAGKDYAADQTDYYNTTMSVAATKTGLERQEFLVDRLGKLDESSPVYAKLAEQANNATATITNQQWKNQLTILGDTTQSDLEGSLRTALDNGADYDVVVKSDYGQRMLRAINFGIVEVTEEGKFKVTSGDAAGTIVGANEFNEELDMALRAEIGKAVEGMDPARANVLFGTGINSDNFASSRAKSRGSGPMTPDEERQLFTDALGDDPGHLQMSLVGEIDSKDPKERAAKAEKLMDGFTAMIMDSDYNPSEKLRMLDTQQQLLDSDGWAAGWGLGDVGFSEGALASMRKNIRSLRRNVTDDALAETFDVLGGINLANSKDVSRGLHASLKDSDVKRLVELQTKSAIVLHTSDGKYVTVPASDYEQWAAEHRDFTPVGVVMENPEDSGRPDGAPVGKSGLSIYGKVPEKKTDGGQEYVHPKVREQFRHMDTIRLYESGEGNIAEDDKDVQRLAREFPMRAMALLESNKQFTNALAAINADPEAKKNIRAYSTAALAPDQYPGYDEWQQQTFNLRRVLTKSGGEGRTLLGFPEVTQSGSNRAGLTPEQIQAGNMYALAMYGEQIFDDPGVEWDQFDVANRINVARQYLTNPKLWDNGVTSVMNEALSPSPEEGQISGDAQRLQTTVLRHYNDQHPDQNFETMDELLSTVGSAPLRYYEDHINDRNGLFRMTIDDPDSGNVNTVDGFVQSFVDSSEVIFSNLNYSNDPRSPEYFYEEGSPEATAASLLIEATRDPNNRIALEAIGQQLFEGVRASGAELADSNALGGFFFRNLKKYGYEGALDKFDRLAEVTYKHYVRSRSPMAVKHGKEFTSPSKHDRITALSKAFRDRAAQLFKFDRNSSQDNATRDISADETFNYDEPTGGTVRQRGFSAVLNPDLFSEELRAGLRPFRFNAYHASNEYFKPPTSQ